MAGREAVAVAELVYNVTEAAQALGISRQSMYNLIHLEGFPTLMVGGRRLISRELLAEWVKTQAGGQNNAAQVLEHQDGREVGMEIRLELNQRHGREFQLRPVHGPVNKVYDQESMNLYQVGTCANKLLKELNQELGTGYKPQQVFRVPGEALEANAGTDFAAARMLQDIKSGTFDLSVPAEPDVKEMLLDGKKELMLSGRGVVLFYYSAWRDDKNEKALSGLRHYCEYIAAHGYRGGATKALAELKGLGKDDAVAWIKRTYARHVHDDEALMQYVIVQ